MNCSYVLITRPEHDAQEIAQEVEALGFSPVIAPMLEIVPFAFSLPEAYQALVFTSANAVRVAAEKMQARDMPVYCVGERTAQTTKKHGWENVKSAEGDIQSLNEMLTEENFFSGLPLLHLCGEDVAGEVGVGVPGISVVRICVYKAEKVEELPVQIKGLLEQRKITTALFFSARTAQAFSFLLRKTGRTQLADSINALCLSDSVVKSLVDLPWKDVQVAKKPNRVAMLDMLTEHKG